MCEFYTSVSTNLVADNDHPIRLDTEGVQEELWLDNTGLNTELARASLQDVLTVVHSEMEYSNKRVNVMKLCI